MQNKAQAFPDTKKTEDIGILSYAFRIFFINSTSSAYFPTTYP